MPGPVLEPHARSCPGSRRAGRPGGVLADSSEPASAEEGASAADGGENLDIAEDEGPGAPSAPLAAAVAAPTAFVRADVALGEPEPVVGSFTADGLTYAVTGQGEVGLACASDDAPLADGGALELPASVSCEGARYSLTSVAPYAFHLSDAEQVIMPASVSEVDGRAFRSCAVQRVEADPASQAFSSYDGILYDAGLARLLLIPGGRGGEVAVPDNAEVIDASAFSHCAGIASISVDGHSSNFSSWDGSLYSADGTALLRVPAGATDITIKDGCTTIAAGAMEGCAKLESITAPASVSSISPYAFSQEPETVSLPAATMVDGAEEPEGEGPEEGQGEDAEEPEGALGSEVPTSPRPPSGSSMGTADEVQISSTVALTASDDSLPEVDSSSIQVILEPSSEARSWEEKGFLVVRMGDAAEGAGDTTFDASAQGASSYAGNFTGALHPVYHSIKETYFTHNADYTETIISERLIPSDEWTRVSGMAYYNVYRDRLTFCMGNRGDSSILNYCYRYTSVATGYTLRGFHPDVNALNPVPVATEQNSSCVFHALWRPNSYSIALHAQGGSVSQSSIAATYDKDATLPAAARTAYRFLGWDTQQDGRGTRYQAGAVRNLTGVENATVSLYAQWEPYTIGFDVDSEPGDVDCPGDAKDPMTSDDMADDGTIAVDPPTRPGYVFQGWVVDGKPNDEGLLTESPDGTWSVDASKLPEYADGNGKVDLTARWTAAISVDAPISATFMYDLSAWDGTESRDAMTVEGSSTVRNRSAVPIRVSGLESETGAAANVLKKSDGTTLADASKGDEAKVLSVFPTTSDATGTEADAKGGASDDAGDDLAHKVDLALSEIKLEEAFDADAWAIPAGASANGAVTAPGEAKLGYRLNLGTSTGVTLDKDALLAATGDPEAGSSSKAASIADLTYCFAADYGPSFWTYDDDGQTVLSERAIKADAEAIASGDAALAAKYQRWLSEDHRFYVRWFDQGLPEFEGGLAAGAHTTYEVRIIGINHDDKADGSGKAGLTFQFVGLLKDPCMMNYPTCGTLSHYNGAGGSASYDAWDNVMDGASRIHNTVTGGWGSSLLRARMNPGAQPEASKNPQNPSRDDDGIWSQLPSGLARQLAPVQKGYWDGSLVASGSALRASGDHLFILSCWEVLSSGLLASMTGKAAEGGCYEFYRLAATQGSHASSALARTRAGSSEGWRWWLRTTRNNLDDYESVTADGVVGGGGRPSSALLGVCPAFCL